MYSHTLTPCTCMAQVRKHIVCVSPKKTVTPHSAMSYTLPLLITPSTGFPSSPFLESVFQGPEQPCEDRRPHLSGALTDRFRPVHTITHYTTSKTPERRFIFLDSFFFFFFDFFCFFCFFCFFFFTVCFFFLLAFLFILFFLFFSCLRFFWFFTVGQVTGNASDGLSRHQIFLVCKVNLATLKVTTKKGYTWSARRLTKIHTTSGPEFTWPLGQKKSQCSTMREC